MIALMQYGLCRMSQSLRKSGQFLFDVSVGELSEIIGVAIPS